MDLSPVVLSIPIFFTLMAAELVFEAVTKKHTYRVSDALTNIITGTLQQLTGTFLKVVQVGAFAAVYQYLAPIHLPENVWTFWGVFILYDLGYYWAHRMAHEVSLFWGGHVVHHQSEDYNLSVALRQSSTQFFWSIPFYLPIALMGFSPVQFALASGFNLLYQFWIHTEHIGKLGPLEWVMNTPSHHRVHHGRNPKYIDKNYAGVFIIWDRLFGTFKLEEERPDYGITKPLKSWNPVYANFAHYIDLAQALRQSRSLKDSLNILFKPPGWMPDYLGGPMLPSKVNPDYEKYDQVVTRGRKSYVILQFFILLGGASYFFFFQDKMEPWLRYSLATWIFWTTLMMGFLLEKNSPWVKGLEGLRIAVTIVLFLIVMQILL